ncbi:olfactory receptor 8D1-like [Brienomyrus brachyistius]|uniref:olfactory receptor 8D1-like n=1 Tax=Brienomyrus brachyistius TaxID=42636 RepID=UPI0020B37F4F|nr:olfactory receptor 8D1-like [Brienomyrus brachyistius]XP_048838758.1 olfactory receptor 8D1-like [Brienomyrus brachyistius]
METTTQDLSNFTRPVGFYIRGFYALKHTEYYFIFLAVMYVLTLVANLTLMFIIWFAETLHTPKYMAVFSLAVVDLSFSSALIPKAVHMYLFDSKFMYFNACLAQMFFVDYFASMEAFSLCVLAYDRLIAICFPLRSNSLNTKCTMMVIIIVSWSIPLVIDVVMVALIPPLPYCKSTVVNSFFCDHGPVFKIACGDYSPNWFMAGFTTVSMYFVPFGFIALTYIFIIYAILNIASSEGRWKAFRTCSSHLLLVGMFFVPFFVTYVIAWVNINIDTDTRIINTSLSASIPPLLNPIIYSLKTEEIMEQIKKILGMKTPTRSV